MYGLGPTIADMTQKSILLSVIVKQVVLLQVLIIQPILRLSRGQRVLTLHSNHFQLTLL